MDAVESSTLSLLHDLTLLFFRLAHGADQELTLEERAVITQRLRQWLPDQNPALIEHVIRDAALTYLEGMDEAAFEDLINRLGTRLDEPMREVVLNDLSEIAQADGVLQISEKEVLDQIQEAWAFLP